MRVTNAVKSGWLNIAFQAVFLGALYAVGHSLPIPGEPAGGTSAA